MHDACKNRAKRLTSSCRNTAAAREQGEAFVRKLAIRKYSSVDSLGSDRCMIKCSFNPPEANCQDE